MVEVRQRLMSMKPSSSFFWFQNIPCLHWCSTFFGDKTQQSAAIMKMNTLWLFSPQSDRTVVLINLLFPVLHTSSCHHSSTIHYRFYCWPFNKFSFTAKTAHSNNFFLQFFPIKSYCMRSFLTIPGHHHYFHFKAEVKLLSYPLLGINRPFSGCLKLAKRGKREINFYSRNTLLSKLYKMYF